MKLNIFVKCIRPNNNRKIPIFLSRPIESASFIKRAKLTIVDRAVFSASFRSCLGRDLHPLTGARRPDQQPLFSLPAWTSSAKFQQLRFAFSQSQAPRTDGLSLLPVREFFDAGLFLSLQHGLPLSLSVFSILASVIVR